MERLLIYIVPAIIIGFLVQILLHEVGHLLGGIFTGWRLLFVQIYRFVIKRTNNGFRLITVNDIGYQCIMYPKSMELGAKLYTMGGCIVNIISAAMGLLLLCSIRLSPVMWLYTWCLFVFGIGMFIMNGSSSIKRVCNDKACYDLIKYNNHTRLCHNAQLITAKYLMSGLSYKQIGKESICLCPDMANNDIEAYQSILEYYYYLDIGNYMRMGQALNKIRNKENISKEVLDIMDMELIYVRLLCAIKLYIKKISERNSRNLSSTLIDGETFVIKIDWDNLKRHSKKGSVHTLRIETVYDAYLHFIKEKYDEAANIIDRTIDAMRQSRYVYEGEKLFCISQLTKVKELMKIDKLRCI